MAELRRRGQVLVIGALGLAVLLSLMALALNAAVFGEVHAAQSDDNIQAEHGAIGFQDAARRGISGLVPAVNNQSVEYDTHERQLKNGVANWSELAEREYARDDVATNVSVKNISYETTIIQNDSREFTDNSSSQDWTVAENVSDVRGYQMNVTDQQLVNTSDCTSSECFTLTVDGESNTWRMVVHETATENINVTVDTPSNGTTSCTTSDSDAQVDVTNGTFSTDSSTCDFTGLANASLNSPYTIIYNDSDNVYGTYNLTVDGRLVDGKIANDARYGTTGSPRLDPRIIATTLRVRYSSVDLTYASTIRVTPGETDG